MEAPIEIEAKFAVAHLEPVRQQLLARAAHLRLPRLREANLRFDFRDGRLQRSGQVLRIRSNHDSLLTFKARGPDVEHRIELEVGVADPQAARRLLEALGLQVVFVYEKYRETYALEGCQVMLDELPFGYFVEVEGDTLAEVRRVAEALGFAWDGRLASTYLELFENLRRRHAYPFRDATFANFAGRATPGADERLATAGPE